MLLRTFANEILQSQGCFYFLIVENFEFWNFGLPSFPLLQLLLAELGQSPFLNLQRERDLARFSLLFGLRP